MKNLIGYIYLFLPLVIAAIVAYPTYITKTIDWEDGTLVISLMVFIFSFFASIRWGEEPYDK